MKRDESLQSLSRDHHHALAVASWLTRAGRSDAEAAANGFLEFWRENGARHFRIEEEQLLPDFARYADPTDERVVRVLTDHVEIRRRAADLETAATADAEQVNKLGELLEAHVEHEENVLFPMIEETLPADALSELAARIEQAERSA